MKATCPGRAMRGPGFFLLCWFLVSLFAPNYTLVCLLNSVR